MGTEESTREALADAYTDYIVSRLGMPASSGRIFAALLLSPGPLSQAQLRSHLSLSEGSISEGLRLLVGRGFVERSGDPRARPAFFQVRVDTWAQPASGTMDNAKATLELAALALRHAEEHDIAGPSLELLARTHAMFEVFVAEMPAVMEKAVAAGARAATGRGERASA
jgi:hypothetical protein